MNSTRLSLALWSVVVSLAVLWSVYLLDWVIPVQFTGWGIVPRRWNGLVGIPLSPLIHDGMGHLVSNSIPLAILMFLFVSSRKKPWLRIVEVTLLGGLLLWLFGRNGAQEPVVHVGASLLIYGLIAYLIVIGFREKHPASLVIALVVGFLYGGTLIWGVLPTSPKISWDGHLAGAIAGAALAFLFPTESDPTDSESPVDLLRRHGFDVD